MLNSVSSIDLDKPAFEDSAESEWIANAVYYLLIFVIAPLILLLDDEKYIIHLKLYITHSNSHVCSACKKESKNSEKFTEVQSIRFPIRKGQFPCIKLLRSKNRSLFLEPSPTSPTDVFIHDCGGIQNIAFEMSSEKPVHLLCLPTKDYSSIIVEEKSNYLVGENKYEFAKLKAQPHKSGFCNLYKTLLLLLCPLARYFFIPQYTCTGSIIFNHN